MIKRALGVLVLLVLLWAYVAFNQREQEAPIDGVFYKVDTAGKILSSWAGPWACVLDKEQGLLWEVKTDSETIHDGYWSYSWFNGDVGVPNMGDCYFEEDRCDVQDLIDRTNDERLCGVAGWRLPSAKELLSLIEKDVKPDAPMIAKAFFSANQAWRLLVGGFW